VGRREEEGKKKNPPAICRFSVGSMRFFWSRIRSHDFQRRVLKTSVPFPPFGRKFRFIEGGTPQLMEMKQLSPDNIKE